MRFPSLSKLLTASGLLVLVFTPILANVTNEDVIKLLPNKMGDLRATRKAELTLPDQTTANDYEKEFSVTRPYQSSKGEKFTVTLVKSLTDRGAFALFSTETQKLLIDSAKVDGVGTVAAADSTGHLLIYKGLTFVSITDESSVKNPHRLTAFARSLVEPLDKSEGEIPVIVKHLPEWETKQLRAIYTFSLNMLQQAAGNRAALDAVSFSGGAEAVTALYGSSRLVIVELTTPQLATECDSRIKARINELRTGGQPIPSAYRRVGNYVVFVFDATDETTAAQLIEKISYEQVVQWLGDNPNWLIRAEREYRETTAGVILAVFKVSGISLLVCLGIGGIFGSIIFRRRRAEQASAQAYSDAGGMLRLNIDEMTPEVDSSRLLGKGEG